MRRRGQSQEKHSSAAHDARCMLHGADMPPDLSHRVPHAILTRKRAAGPMAFHTVGACHARRAQETQMAWTLVHIAALALGGGLLICACVYGLTADRRAPQPAPARGWRAFLSWGFYLLSTGLLVAVGTRSITFLPLVLLAH